MSALEPLFHSISRFYHRWDALEQSLGADGGSVIDFDFCPRAHLDALEPRFTSRIEALTTLMAIQEAVAAQPDSAFANAEMLKARLHGSEVYLRALLGQRLEYTAYVGATMGYHPIPTPKDELERMRNRCIQTLAAMDIPFEENAREQYDARLVEEDIQVFVRELEDEIPKRVSAIRSAVGLTAEPYWKLEIHSADAYWANWILGGITQGIILKINTHPRIRFNRHSGIGFAAHEVGGHALNVLELTNSARAGRVDSPLLCLTVHACEAFQMEGLAQTILELTQDINSLPIELQAEDHLRAFSAALMNDAQLRLEGGDDILSVYRWLKEQSPLMRDHKVLPELRDRMRNPLYRSYIGVYAPARQFFRRAHRLPWGTRMQFLQKIYSELYTPSQLLILMDRLEAENQAEVSV